MTSKVLKESLLKRYRRSAWTDVDVFRFRWQNKSGLGRLAQ